MATQATITASSARVPDFSNVLDAFETIQGKCAAVQSLVQSAGNEISADRISLAGMHIIDAAGMIAEQIDQEFTAAVNLGYAAMIAGAAA